MFAKSILDHFSVWVEEDKNLPVEQAGFRKKHCTLDNIFTKKLIVKQYVSICGPNIDAAFIVFTTAFDMVDHPTLWRKLKKLGIPETLLTLVTAFHFSTWCQALLGGDRAFHNSK